MKVFRFCFLAALLFFTIQPCFGYRIITPLPFSVANKNYIKIQLLAEKGDTPADSIFYDILYNAGTLLTKRMNASMSDIITLNEFNDGVFNVQARIYHGLHCDTISSKYSSSGIPVLLDRHLSYNETIFKSVYIEPAKNAFPLLKKMAADRFAGNNNTVVFNSGWNEDSIYFRLDIKDAQLNTAPSAWWDLFQAKKFLEVVWTSDCIEFGFDLQHDRREWKDTGDYEFLVNIAGKRAGNQWSIPDSIYNHWGSKANVHVELSGTVNQNEDIDSGYVITMAIPWSEMKYRPMAGHLIGFDLQLYDKDAATDEPFRSSLSGTNPESNDNTSEWVSLLLEAKPASYTVYLYWLALPVMLLLLWILRKKGSAVAAPLAAPPSVSTLPAPSYSESIQKTIELITAQYHDTELSRTSLAAQVFLSEKYLSALFKKEVGENLVSYINRFRIERAEQLLKETRLPITEIAFQVGYNSVQNFNKNFKSITGQSPSDVRKTT